MATANDLTVYLNKHDVEYTRLVHQPVSLPSELAATTSVPERCIAQTILVRADEHFWMVVYSADRKIDFEALARLLEAKKVRVADETDMMFFFTEGRVGPLPPFGNLYGFPVIADLSLREGGRMLFSACSPRESIFMRWQDYQRLVRPIEAEFTQPSSASAGSDLSHGQPTKQEGLKEELHLTS